MKNKNDEGYEIALKKIQEAQYAEANELDLSFLGLKILPPEVFELTTLKSLYLNDNKLKSLPAKIIHLTSLHSLYLSSNQLHSLPTEFGQLSNLQKLDLRNNLLASLPSELKNLQGKINILLKGNLFGELPTLAQQPSTRETFDYPSVLAKGKNMQQWVSKLMVVGEGGAGKSCTLRALRDEAFQTLDTSYGIEQNTLELPHPE
jgi:internalin A